MKDNKREISIVRSSAAEYLTFITATGEGDVNAIYSDENVWLTQKMMGVLYNVETNTINYHLKKIFMDKEVDENSVIRKFRITAADGKTYNTEFYNLDVIISVGYRVNSKHATNFRIWANRILKEYLIKGYAINHNAKAEQLDELKQTIAIMRNVLTHKSITQDEAVGLLRVISDYSYGLDTLDRYDYQTLDITQTTKREVFRATYEDAIEALVILKDKFGGSDLFAHEKDDSFKSTMGVIYQTFDGQELYPSIEEKAANLLYLTVKNHSFSDGNKRIAAFLFLWFLEKNGILYREDGSRLLDNNTLVALTLMIAQSKVEEKDIMTKVVVNLINQNN